jgi:hypothetical protein
VSPLEQRQPCIPNTSVCNLHGCVSSGLTCTPRMTESCDCDHRYTLAPEKFVFMAALGRGGMKLPGFEDMAALHFHRICAHGGLISKIGSSLVIVLDLCGIGALVAAFVPGGSGLTKATRFLAIGYVASALGTVSLLGLAWLHPNKGKTSAELNSVL